MEEKLILSSLLSSPSSATRERRAALRAGETDMNWLGTFSSSIGAPSSFGTLLFDLCFLANFSGLGGIVIVYFLSLNDSLVGSLGFGSYF